MVADSLLRDHDLSLERDYAEGRYRDFHPDPLAPHYRVRGREGAIYSLHAVGLSLLVLPAYAAASYAGASFFMALLAVWLACELRALAAGVDRRRRGRRRLDRGPQPAARALRGAHLHGGPGRARRDPGPAARTRARRRARTALLTGGAVAFLPWLNVRYAILSRRACSPSPWPRGRRRRVAVAWLAPSLVVRGRRWRVFHFHLYGFFDPRRVYGRRPELVAGRPPDRTARAPARPGVRPPRLRAGVRAGRARPRSPRGVIRGGWPSWCSSSSCP